MRKEKREAKYWNYLNTYEDFNCSKIPRKAKKFLLGTKLTKNHINKRLKQTKGILHKDNDLEIVGGEFCLKCGCSNSETIHHPVEYPEVWYDIVCLRCGWGIGGADNSKYESNLEEFIKIEDCEDENCSCHKNM